MPDEVNIDILLEMATDEERAKKLQGILESCHSNTEDFIRELLGKLRGLRTEHVLRRMSPDSRGDAEPDANIRERV
nr:protein phosphatase 1 regulatory subunit 14A-like [Pogona vitticeps]